VLSRYIMFIQLRNANNAGNAKTKSFQQWVNFLKFVGLSEKQI
jgi:hypothetical protein